MTDSLMDSSLLVNNEEIESNVSTRQPVKDSGHVMINDTLIWKSCSVWLMFESNFSEDVGIHFPLPNNFNTNGCHGTERGSAGANHEGQRPKPQREWKERESR